MLKKKLKRVDSLTQVLRPILPLVAGDVPQHKRLTVIEVMGQRVFVWLDRGSCVVFAANLFRPSAQPNFSRRYFSDNGIMS